MDGGGKVIGISVAYIPPQARAVSIGFAIPAPTVTDVVTELLKDGEVDHAFFGVRPAPLTPQIASRLGVEVSSGVLVLDLVAGGPASEAGIRPGDVIVAAGGAGVADVEDFLALLRRRAPGEKLNVKVVRGEDELQLDVVLGERPEL